MTGERGAEGGKERVMEGENEGGKGGRERRETG